MAQTVTRGVGLRRALRDPARWRLASGLVLFAFVLTHLVNHALGLVSQDAMQAMQDARLAVTRSAVGMSVLIAAALVHLVLGLLRIVQAGQRRMDLRQAVQLMFGLMIPVLLIRHVLGTHGVAILFGITDDYAYALWAMWPGEAVSQALLMTLVWVHGGLGMHYWLAHRGWYQRTFALWQGVAVLIPALAYAGFVSAGRLAAVQGGYAAPFQPGQYAQIANVMQVSKRTYLAILALALLGWALLWLTSRMGQRIAVTYVNGPTVSAPRGLSLLAISQMHRIPHAAVCGGRARCSTCRVRVLAGQDHLPPPSDQEYQVLRRVRAPDNVRLACQVHPTAALKISTLFPADFAATGDAPDDKYLWGVEQEVTVMFCDLRGFTKMSEGRLPYDVVFLLNQFLGRMAETIEDAGGHVDKFMGDGIMAIFGMDRPADLGAQAALRAAAAMGGVLDALNQSLRETLPAPLSMGIGLHTGMAILGRIGAAQGTRSQGNRSGAAQLTALGETVNLASRLERTCKELGVQLVISAACAARAGLSACDKTTVQSVNVRGLSVPVEVLTLRRAAELTLPDNAGDQGIGAAPASGSNSASNA